MKRRNGRLSAIVLAVGLLATACGSNADTAAAAAEPAAVEAVEAVPTGPPGAGITVNMARADWKESHFQNVVVQKLLIELGYEVAPPVEMDPATFFEASAKGEFDLWASTWPLNHDPLTEAELIGGGVIADNVTRVGTMMSSGALQGLLVDRASVEQFGFTTLDELLADPAAVAHFDTTGDSRADINGCDEGWGCQKVINDTIEANGWGDRIVQVSESHADLFTLSQASFDAGGPVLQYVWTPTAFVGKLVPGRDVVWLAVDPESTIEGQAGISAVGSACTAEQCTTMFTPSDIVVTANRDWLAANPAAESLLQNFVMDPVAVAVVAVAIDAGNSSQADVERAADDWIEDNRRLVDAWMKRASAAAL